MDARSSRYHEVYAQWQRDPEGFWGEAAKEIDWFEPAEEGVRSVDGRLWPLVRRRRLQHLLQRASTGMWRPGAASRRRSSTIPRSPAPRRRSPTRNCCFEVSTLAAMLQDFGVGKGDRVILYMPMVPEAVFAMLACARIGAVHSVVFGGFAAKELANAHRRRQAEGDPLRRAAASSRAASSPTSRCSTRRSSSRSTSPPPASSCSGRRSRPR